MNRPPIDKEWTPELALAEQQKFQSAGGEWNDPYGPFFQWASLHVLDDHQKRFANGDKHALAMALSECARHKLVMPEWVADAYSRGFHAIHNYREKSWNNVFGQPIPKGAHLSALRKRRQFLIHVVNAVNEAKLARIPVNKELFAGIGKKLNLGVTLVEQYYYGKKKPSERPGRKQSRKKRKI